MEGTAGEQFGIIFQFKSSNNELKTHTHTWNHRLYLFVKFPPIGLIRLTQEQSGGKGDYIHG